MLLTGDQAGKPGAGWGRKDTKGDGWEEEYSHPPAALETEPAAGNDTMANASLGTHTLLYPPSFAALTTGSFKGHVYQLVFVSLC